MTPRNLLGGMTAFPVNVYVFSAKGALQDEAWGSAPGFAGTKER
jgi:hypothetical protein